MLENELRDKVAEGHEGKRKTESLWPIHQISWQRSRYVFDMFFKYKKISREVSTNIEIECNAVYQHFASTSV